MNKTELIKKVKALKTQSGSHSPSIDTLLDIMGKNSIKVDACFLSNPYATELFNYYLEKLILDKKEWGRTLEFYPPQNFEIAKNISKINNIPFENILVGNGAIEIIQILIHNYVKNNICVIIPTFSPYYEYVKDGVEIKYYNLKKEQDFKLDVDDLINFCNKEKIMNLCLINPNNPNGHHISHQKIEYLFNELKHLDNIIIDESFIHFAYEESSFSNVSVEKCFNDYDNITIIKSMSKDFGIAGIRCGYGILNKNRVSEVLQTGYLWNISGLGAYFFKLYSSSDFISKYEFIRKKYIMNTQNFISQLIVLSNKTSKIKIYPSKANFVLIEIINYKTSFEVMTDLLIEFGIYVRECSDKIGLNGEFIRVASRNFEENTYMINSFEKYFCEK